MEQGKKYHWLKTEMKYFKAVAAGAKMFEVRKNDRGYKVGDILVLEESVEGVKTGRVLTPLEVVYILHGPLYGVQEGYCVMGLQP